MRKHQKKVTVIVMAVVLLLLSIMMTGCVKKDDKYKETEYFIYHIYDAGDHKEARIDRLTEKGKQLKNIVIPEEIDGMPVTSLRGYYEAPNATKIVISHNLKTINSIGLSRGSNFIHGYPRGLKILYVNCRYEECANFGKGGYIASNAQKGYSEYLKVYQFANIQYLFNYADAPNMNVFFIDDLEVNKELEIIPENPKRAGYVFTGWYSESECINRIELIGYVKADEEIVYLYAGWEENNK